MTLESVVRKWMQAQNCGSRFGQTKYSGWGIGSGVDKKQATNCELMRDYCLYIDEKFQKNSRFFFCGW